ncbi:hypothetical protein ACRAKI_23905 [Saccharothrix isguenensis]
MERREQVSTRPGVESDPADWWATHETGNGGRPRPTTRVAMGDGRTGTVQPYEGCWKASTFPVLIDFTGQTLMMRTADVAVMTPGGHTTPRTRDRSAG